MGFGKGEKWGGEWRLILTSFKKGSMANRRKFTSEFKKQVVLEALKERETLSELAQKYDVHPQQITTWKAHFLAHAESIFEKEGSATKEQDLDKERDALLRAIGQQKIEIDFLKKKLR